MEKSLINLEVSKLDLSQCSDSEKSILLEARNQLKTSYAPYSKFNVGASLLLKNGRVIGGSNQENASYPLCMCAERVALYHAAIQEPNVIIEAIAITAQNENKTFDTPVMPCGACRQVMLEYELKQNHPIKVYVLTQNDKVLSVDSAKSLLPLSFDGSQL